MRSTASRICVGLCATLAAMLAGHAYGLPFQVPINTSQSSLTVQLCVVGTCDTDSSPVSGYVIMELDCVDQPTQDTLYDFRLELTQDLNFLLSWGIFGQLSATATDMGILDAQPDTPFGPVPLVNSQFAFEGVPTNGEGIVAYHATGVACTLLQNSGYLCTDSISLAEQGTQSGTQSGTITTANRLVQLVTAVDTTQPLDPNNPSLGTVHVYGTVRGQVLVPRPPGDVDGDGDVDYGDLLWFETAMAGPDVTTPPPGCSAYHFAGSDLEVDGDADLADYALLERYRGT